MERHRIKKMRSDKWNGIEKPYAYAAKQQAGDCNQRFKTGTCVRGDGCQYKHEREGDPSEIDRGRKRLKTPKGGKSTGDGNKR